jgi:hypothetical protein
MDGLFRLEARGRRAAGLNTLLGVENAVAVAATKANIPKTPMIRDIFSSAFDDFFFFFTVLRRGLRKELGDGIPR